MDIATEIPKAANLELSEVVPMVGMKDYKNIDKRVEKLVDKTDFLLVECWVVWKAAESVALSVVWKENAKVVLLVAEQVV